MKSEFGLSDVDFAGKAGRTPTLTCAVTTEVAIHPAAGFLLGLVLTVILLYPHAAAAQALPLCSWPLKTTGGGLTNVAYPDTNATYWTMPFDSGRWKEIVLTGTYPEARFISFITYEALGSVADSLLDFAIKPDLHSENPFKPGKAGGGGGQGHAFGNTYTISISRDGKAAKGGNHLGVADTTLGWVIYRIYVPDQGKNRKGGVDLPAVTLVAHDGSTRPLAPCAFPDFVTAAESLITSLVAHGFQDAADFLETKALVEGDDGGAGPGGAVCAPDQVAFAIPQNTGGYFPNAANKYIAAPDLCFQPDRVVVVRGKGAAMPDTYNGAPVWQPAGQFEHVALRYWSMCNNDQETPYPVVACQADWATKLDDQGFYTYVVSDDTQPPAWLPPDATWLPWGSTDVPNILIFRNMLPAPSFRQSVQAAEAAGCTFDNEPGETVPYGDIVDAGQCAHEVMGAYYPAEVYCDTALFTAQGWQGCFAAAGVATP